MSDVAQWMRGRAKLNERADIGLGLTNFVSHKNWRQKGRKKGAVPLGNCTYRATICCAVPSSPMAMAITVTPPAVAVPPINSADNASCGRELSASA